MTYRRRCAPALLSLCLMMAAPAFAQEQQQQQAQPDAETTQAHSAVVTSVESCAIQLDLADAAAVRQSLKPYQECQQLLQKKLLKKQAEAEAQAKAAPEAPVAETPRNYVRVQKAPVAPGPTVAPAAQQPAPAPLQAPTGPSTAHDHSDKSNP